MKHYLLHIHCLLAVLLAVPLRAQDARGRSRLEMGRSPADRKAVPATRVIHSRNFPFLKHPTLVGLDRPVNVSKSVALNDYYRSLLIAAPGTTARLTPRPADVVATVATPAAAVPAEPRAPTADVRETTRSDERLYSSDRIVVSNVYPNPASTSAELDYQIASGVGEAKLILLNVLGAPIAEYVLDRNDRKVQIATSGMAAGVYFYQLSVDGRKVATKKLLVRHQ